MVLLSDEPTPPPGHVTLDGLLVEIEGDVDVQDLGTFVRGGTFGDPTKGSDPLLSVRVYSDLTGGGQVEDENEGSDPQRYHFGIVDARRPHMALPPLATRITRPSGMAGDCYPMVDFGGEFLVAWGVNLCSVNTTTLAVTDLDDLAFAPVGQFASAVFDGKVYIGQGANGYQTWNGTAVAAGTAGLTAVAFAVWDNKLFALQHDGQLAHSPDGTTWTEPATAKIKDGSTPRALIEFTDRAGEDAIFAVTTRSVWGYDAAASVLAKTKVKSPPHPDNGRGVEVWPTGGDLFVSHGMEVTKTNLDVRSFAGPARDFGVPALYRGRINSLVGSHDTLWALVEGQSFVVEGEDTIEVDTGLWGQTGELTVTGSNSIGTLLANTGSLGWHGLWSSAGAGGTPSWAQVSAPADAAPLRLFWGYGSDLMTFTLDKTFSNPREQRLAGAGEFAPTGWLETGWFDAALPFDKLGSHIEVVTDYASATETFAIAYMVDDDVSWTPLGTASTTGKTTLPLGVRAADGWSEGVPFSRIRFRFDLARDPEDATQSPILETVNFKFMPLPESTLAFTLKLPLRDSYDRGPREIAEWVRQLLLARRFLTFRHSLSDQPYRVREAQYAGNNPGGDRRGERTITLVQIKGGTAVEAS